MDKTNLRNLKEQLKKHGVRPLKRLGQNFLINEKVADKFIEALQLSKEDIVVEVGSGTGFLTKKLSQRAKMVIAIEKDEKMAEISKENLGNLKNIKFIKGPAAAILPNLILSLTFFIITAPGATPSAAANEFVCFAKFIAPSADSPVV